MILINLSFNNYYETFLRYLLIIKSRTLKSGESRLISLDNIILQYLKQIITTKLNIKKCIIKLYFWIAILINALR